MMRKLKSLTIQMMLGANIVSIILMLAVGFSDRLHPSSFPALSTAGLAFPVFLLINFCFLIFWCIFYFKGVIVPLLGFVICYAPIRQYCPFNMKKPTPPDAIKVLSYNVWLFAGWEDKPGEQNPILEYLKKQNADILCLQESSPQEIGEDKINQALNPIYPYHDWEEKRGDRISIYSKYPIISKETIPYPSMYNLSAAYMLNVNGDSVIVINNHLESTGLDAEDKERFKAMVKGNAKVREAQSTSRLLVHKLGEATQKRAVEAEAVARYISYHREYPMIVCGDFNDSPISYTHHTIAQGLKDCYVETANGPGISYHHNGFYVRIDNIMCSDDFEPYACRVDNSIKSSDHYPIYCWLKKRQDTQKK